MWSFNNYYYIFFSCTDQLIKYETEIKNLCLKLYPKSEIHIYGYRSPLFTYWFSKLQQKPNFGKIYAISRIIDQNEEGMICGLFTRIKTDSLESMVQFDAIKTTKNDFKKCF